LFLFILESIGTPELILIAIVALIVLGPRKLPQMAKTIGKTMSEFRNATHEFKSTWEKEVIFEDQGKFETTVNTLPEKNLEGEISIAKNSLEIPADNQFPAPQVRELRPEEFPPNFQLNGETKVEAEPEENKTEKTTTDKREWL
jgi:Tat protein translocase TatB subunit